MQIAHFGTEEEAMTGELGTVNLYIDMAIDFKVSPIVERVDSENLLIFLPSLADYLVYLAIYFLYVIYFLENCKKIISQAITDLRFV